MTHTFHKEVQFYLDIACWEVYTTLVCIWADI